MSESSSGMFEQRIDNVWNTCAITLASLMIAIWILLQEFIQIENKRKFEDKEANLSFDTLLFSFSVFMSLIAVINIVI